MQSRGQVCAYAVDALARTDLNFGEQMPIGMLNGAMACVDLAFFLLS